MKRTAQHLIKTFFSELKYGLDRPAIFEELYNDDECLKLKVWFNESGGGASPDSEPYRLEVKRFEFYTLTEKAKWKYINPELLGISINDFNEYNYGLFSEVQSESKLRTYLCTSTAKIT